MLETFISIVVVILLSLLYAWVSEKTSAKRGASRVQRTVREIDSSPYLDETIRFLDKRISEGCQIGRIDRGYARLILEPSDIYPYCNIEGLTQAAEKICQQYGLIFANLSANFVPGLGKPGLIELSDTWEGIIGEIAVDLGYSRSPSMVAAILAHELAHVLLTTLDIYGETIEVERKTDVAIFVCGMGKLPLNAIWESSGPSAAFRGHLGYLSPEEMAYVYFRTCVMNGISYSEAIAGLNVPAKRYMRNYQKRWR